MNALTSAGTRLFLLLMLTISAAAHAQSTDPITQLENAINNNEFPRGEGWAGFLDFAFLGHTLATLILATIAMLIALEIAIFGFFPGLTDPGTIQDTAMLFVLASAILNVISFIAGFGHELRKMEQRGEIP